MDYKGEDQTVELIGLPDGVSVTYKIDKVAPTGTVSFGENNKWNEFLDAITFELLYKDEITVKVEANDANAGILSVEYYEADKPMTLEEVKSITSWSVISEKGVAVSVEDAKEFVYYIRVSDKAGNVEYLSTNGAVYDSQAPVIEGVTDGSIYYTTQKFTVNDKNFENVTVDDKEQILEVKANLESIDTGNATDDEKAEIAEAIANCDELLDEIASILTPTPTVTEEWCERPCTTG